MNMDIVYDYMIDHTRPITVITTMVHYISLITQRQYKTNYGILHHSYLISSPSVQLKC